MRFCLKFLQINGRILRRNLHFIETKCHAEKMCFPSMAFFMVLDLFPDTLLACMRCVNFDSVYSWSYFDLFPHTEKRHIECLSNILKKEKSAEKSALFSPIILTFLTSIPRTQRVPFLETNPPAAPSALHTPFPVTPHNLLPPLLDDRKS